MQFGYWLIGDSGHISLSLSTVASTRPVNAYLRIGGDGRVTCFVGKVELEQGSKTALAQLVADELDVSLDSVDMVTVGAQAESVP